MEFQKIVNFIGTTSDNKDLPTFVTKKIGLKFMINQKEITMLIKKLGLKHQSQGQIYVILVTYILLLKEILLSLKNIYC